jgi:hypothetical protein
LHLCSRIVVTFAQWFGIAAAQAYGHLVNDRLPLYICARNDGVWKPEYRLHALWFPVLIIYPFALGLFGATLYYHWHYMVLAFASFLIMFSGASCAGPSTNYIIEAAASDLANEGAAIMNLYRLAFSLGVPFFLFPWITRVGQNWAFGMMAFFTIFVFSSVVIVIIWGEKIRALNFMIGVKSERGMKVVHHPEEREAV